MGRQTGIERWKNSRAGRSRLQPKLRPSEQTTFDALTADGWKVYRNGWPDFLAERNGELRFIEVKANGDKITVEQRRIHRALALLGITVEIVEHFDA